MSSVSGLSAKHRAEARSRARSAAWLTYKHKEVVHYTQGPRRWEGIDKDFNARMGEFPKYADCSAFATWCIWNGLLIPFGVRDTVNAAAWKAGYTGTMLEHGKRVVHVTNALVADCVIYGPPGSDGEHTAIIVKPGRVPLVISHGSESGPYFLPYNYRSDIMVIRRYI
jgi:hypothetical protein